MSRVCFCNWDSEQVIYQGQCPQKGYEWMPYSSIYFFIWQDLEWSCFHPVTILSKLSGRVLLTIAHFCHLMTCLSCLSYKPVWCDAIVTCKPVWCDARVTCKPVWCDARVTCKHVWCDARVTCKPVWCDARVTCKPVWCDARVTIILMLLLYWLVNVMELFFFQ